MATIPLMEDIEMGEEKTIEGDFAYRNNVHQASTRIRLGFLRKVYSLLFIQLGLTTLIGFIMMAFASCKQFVQENNWLVLVAFVVSIVTLIALHIKRKDSPTNFILLSIFTVVQAFTVGVTITFFDTIIVLQALVITITIVGGLTAFTFQTNKDFSSLGAVLYCALCLLIVGGLIQIFVSNSALEIGISLLGALVFSLFIIYDTQNLMKRVSPEEYILATIELYLDIINLFIYILRILDALRK